MEFYRGNETQLEELRVRSSFLWVEMALREDIRLGLPHIRRRRRRRSRVTLYVFRVLQKGERSAAVSSHTPSERNPNGAYVTLTSLALLVRETTLTLREVGLSAHSHTLSRVSAHLVGLSAHRPSSILTFLFKPDNCFVVHFQQFQRKP